MLTREDALKVAAVISTADGGCENCAAKLAAEANRMFPELVFAVRPDQPFHLPCPSCVNPSYPGEYGDGCAACQHRGYVVNPQKVIVSAPQVVL